MSLPKWFLITVISIVTLVIVVSGSLFAYNQFQLAQISPSKTSSSIETPQNAEDEIAEVDDSAAINALMMTSGALNQLAINQTQTDCQFLLLAWESMLGATPLDSYRGSYEQVLSNVDTVVSLCLLNPSDPNGTTLAVSTRDLISSITGIK